MRVVYHDGRGGDGNYRARRMVCSSIFGSIDCSNVEVKVTGVMATLLSLSLILSGEYVIIHNGPDIRRT